MKNNNVFDIDGVAHKKCPRCEAVKPTTEFYKQPVRYGHPHGLYSRCRECTKKWAKGYRSGKVYREIQARYRAKHKERLSEEMKIRRSTPEYRLEANKKYTERLRDDLNFKLKTMSRRRILCALKAFGVGIRKSAKTEALVGCSMPELVKHIESLFTEGMSWDLLGKNNGIHIDHIMPCGLFDMANPAHQAACFSYKNMQPMWAGDNMVKNDYLPDGRRACNLTREEKDAIISKAFN